MKSNKERAKLLRSAASALEHGRHSTAVKKLTEASITAFTVTASELEAIGYALDLAWGDQSAYLETGSPAQDYGDDWPATAVFKAEQFRAIAQFANRAGLHGEFERWNGLAQAVLS